MRMVECREGFRLALPVICSSGGWGSELSKAGPADSESTKFDSAVSSAALPAELSSGVVSSSSMSQLTSLSVKASIDFVDWEDPIVDPSVGTLLVVWLA